MTTSLSPDHLAVLVVDVQIGPFSTNPAPFEAAEVIRRIRSVTTKARAAGVPVIFVQHQGPPEENWSVPFGWEPVPDLKPEPGEVVVNKTTADAFYNTDLEKILRSRGIKFLMLMGYATDYCMDATLRNAVSKDFEVFVVSDAHTTNDTPILQASAIRQHFNEVWNESYSNRPVHLLSAADACALLRKLNRG